METGVREDLLDRARRLGAALAERAGAAERARRLPAETGRDLRASGLLRIVQPKSHGGFEQDYDLLIETIMLLARSCASSAWVYAIAAGQQVIVANFPALAQDEVWRDPDAVTCGAYMPQGAAEAAPDGFRLTGRWGFVSGCDLADWAVIGAALPLEAGATPCFVLVPASDWSAVDDWETHGLAGTGSKSIRLDGAFVPHHRVLPIAHMTELRAAAAVAHAHPMYRLPMLSFVPSALGAVAVGAAQGAVQSFIAAASGRTTRGGLAMSRSRLAEFTAIQMRVAEALAASDAAQALLLRDNRAALAALAATGDVPQETRIALRRGQGFAVRLAVGAAETVAAATGIAGLALDHPVQRAWRDAVAVSRHISLNWDAVAALVGRHALGLDVPGNF